MKPLHFLVFIGLTASCIPETVKEELDSMVVESQRMVADQEFKKAIAHIELHKLRYGSYPGTLSELKFLSAMDSSTLSFVKYTRLDSGYELNFETKFPSLSGTMTNRIQLQYPDEFWRGLGCVRSNLK